MLMMELLGKKLIVAKLNTFLNDLFRFTLT